MGKKPKGKKRSLGGKKKDCDDEKDCKKCKNALC